MQLGCLVQPHMPVYAGSFIEPSFLQSGIHTHAYQVLTSIVKIFRNIICPGCISAFLMSEIESVHPHLGIAEYSVELQPDMLTVVFLRDCECLSVPSHACFRIFESYGLVTVAVARFSGVRQIHHPVMGQIDVCPSGSIELGRIRAFVMDRCGLGQIVEIFGSASKILCRR